MAKAKSKTESETVKENENIVLDNESATPVDEYGNELKQVAEKLKVFDIGKECKSTFTYGEFKELVQLMCKCNCTRGVDFCFFSAIFGMLGLYDVVEMSKEKWHPHNWGTVINLEIGKEITKSIVTDVVKDNAPITWVYGDGTEVTVENPEQYHTALLSALLGYSDYDLSLEDRLCIEGIIFSPLFKDCRGVDYWLKVLEKAWVLSGHKLQDDACIDTTQHNVFDCPTFLV